MKNRVVLIRSNPVSPDPPVEKMANSLLKLGYDLTILAWDRESKETLKGYIELPDGKAGVIRFGIPATFGGGFRSNLFPLILFQNQIKAWLTQHRQQYDIIHAFDFDTGFVAQKCARKFHKKFVYHVLDYYVASHYIPGGLNSYIEKKEISVINRADATIICSEKRREQIEKAAPRNLFVIHNTPDAALLTDGKLQFKGAGNKIKLVYVGILGPNRFIKEIAEHVINDNRFEFHIGGYGIMEAELNELASFHDNIHFYGKLPYDQTLQLEAYCDIMTAIYDPNVANHKYAAPNKLYEALMLGKPVMMAINTGWDEVIHNHGIGVSIEYTEDGLRCGLDALVNDKDKWSEMGQRARALYEHEYSWAIMEGRIEQLYKELNSDFFAGE